MAGKKDSLNYGVVAAPHNQAGVTIWLAVESGDGILADIGNPVACLGFVICEGLNLWTAFRVRGNNTARVGVCLPDRSTAINRVMSSQDWAEGETHESI
jgi:hypothetical protein